MISFKRKIKKICKEKCGFKVDKVIVVLSDFHTGSEAGLTLEPKNILQKNLLAAYKENIDSCVREYGRIDAVIANGDLIHGKPDISTYYTESDLGEQTRLAFELLKLWGAKKYLILRGTPKHTRSKYEGTEYENTIRDLMNTWKPKCCYITTRVRAYSINGVKFNIRHKVSSSTTPYGSFTLLFKTVINEIIDIAIKERNAELVPDVFIRSHVHYFTTAKRHGMLAITTPAWQAPYDDWGKRICEGSVDVGSIVFTIDKKGHYDYQEYLYAIPDPEKDIPFIM